MSQNQPYYNKTQVVADGKVTMNLDLKRADEGVLIMSARNEAGDTIYEYELICDHLVLELEGSSQNVH